MQNFNANIIQIFYRKYITNKYISLVEPIIENILNKPSNPYNYKPTTFGFNNNNYKALLNASYKVKQRQNREGYISQIVLGNFFSWEDLGVGHESGLDIIKKDKSMIGEIKNKFNTMNSKNKTQVLNELSKYKKENPNCLCFLGIVNPKSRPIKKKIIHNGQELWEYHGYELYKLVFTYNGYNYTELVIPKIQEIINNNY
tara:strand:+ start:160 stop:759 length:600 start_codon:yes stop_codon:yes gene_type:complete